MEFEYPVMLCKSIFKGYLLYKAEKPSVRPSVRPSAFFVTG